MRRRPASPAHRALRDRDDPFALPAHHFPQIWLLCASLALLGLAVLADRELLGTVFALDRSHVTALIAALVGAGSVHAAWHIALYSRRIEAARHALGRAGAGRASDERSREAPLAEPPAEPLAEPPTEPPTEPLAEPPTEPSTEPFVVAWMRDARSAATASGAAREDLLELYADRLRSPVDLGWFLVDVTIRLGLLGTIIGFILIFGSLSGISIDGAEGLRGLLVAMSGGMGTALFTTLAGLVGATLLSVQYLILGREAEHLLGLLVRFRAGLDGPLGARAADG